MKMKYWTAILIFSLFFFLYVNTLAPTVTFRDSGELITAAYTLGISHPPGSPLYLLIAKLFTFLPVGDIAYRVNLMSAFFASLALVVLYFIGLRLFQDILPACFSALVLGISRTFWSYSLIAEVDTLQIFFTAVLILLLLFWKDNPPKRWPLYISALLYGLSFGIHPTMLLLFPAFLYFVIITKPAIFRQGKSIISLILLFIVGLSIFLYLPIRSAQNPPLDYGDPERWRTFLTHLLGKQYHHRVFSSPFLRAFYNLRDYLKNLNVEYTFIPLIFSGLGLWTCGAKKENRKTFFFLILIFVSVLIFNLFSGRRGHHCILTFAILSIWAGYGLKYLGEKIPEKANWKLIAPVFSFLLLLYPLRINYPWCDESENNYAQNYTQQILNALPPESIIFTSGDSIFLFWYVRWIEKERPDIIPICANLLLSQEYAEQLQRNYPQLSFPSLATITKYLQQLSKATVEQRNISFKATMIRDIAQANMDKHPIYFNYYTNLPSSYHFVPQGLVFKLVRSQDEIDLPSPKDTLQELESLLPPLPQRKLNKRIIDQRTRSVYVPIYHQFGQYFQDNGFLSQAIQVYQRGATTYPPELASYLGLGKIYQKQKEIELAKKHFQYIVTHHPFFKETVYDDLGSISQKEGKYYEALGTYKRQIRYFPGYANGYINLGVVYYDLGQVQNSLYYTQLALEREVTAKQRVLIHYNLGVAYLALGKKEEVLEQVKKLRELAPQDKKAEYLLEKLH